MGGGNSESVGKTFCVAACHTVNGVSKLHSEILVNELFKDYAKMTPNKFTNVTNGIARHNPQKIAS